MVQAADFANRDDPTERGPLNWPAVRCILVEREVSARPVIVREEAGQGTAQMPFAKDDDMIETLAPDRADEPESGRLLAVSVGFSSISSIGGAAELEVDV